MTWKEEHENSLIYQALLLGGCAAVAAALLIFGDQSTRSAIAERKTEDMLESLSQVLPSSLHDNDLLESVVSLHQGGPDAIKVYAATKDGLPTGFAFKTTGVGYAGPIELLLGVSADGEILGVRVLAHSETPGLGDKIEVAKDDWILTFDGRSLENTSADQWRVRKDGGDIDALTGATVTPRAVVKAVHEGLIFFDEHEETLRTGAKEGAVHPTAARGDGS